MIFCFHRLLQVLCITGFGPAMILLTYVVSFGFAQVQSNRDFFAVISMMVSQDAHSCVIKAQSLDAKLTVDHAGCFLSHLSGVCGFGHAGSVLC